MSSDAAERRIGRSRVRSNLDNVPARMRLSHLFGSTLKEPPSGTEAVSHQLLVRAGFIRQLGQGLFSYLPLAHRSMAKITSILREEVNGIGGQELSMPVVHPA